MKMRRVTFNVKSEQTAQTIRYRLSMSGIRLRAHLGHAEFDDNATTASQQTRMLQGVTMEVPANMVPAARMVLRELFANNRYGIHSVTIDGQTQISEELTDGWWDDRFRFTPRADGLLERASGASGH
jgi:hypothetical protein